MAVAYALIVSGLIYRDLTPRGIWNAVVDTGTMTGAVMLIIMASSTHPVGAHRGAGPAGADDVGHRRAQRALDGDPGAQPGHVIIGAFLDLPAAVLLLGPLFVTIGQAIGLDPVQLGLMMVVNLSIGLYTPPVGTTLFISAAIAKTGVGEVCRALLPFYGIALIVLLLISYLPFLTIY
jgi:TRAP-type C4-dicarboxylate transport system permease large subunit